jgi:hypothetical protein
MRDGLPHFLPVQRHAGQNQPTNPPKTSSQSLQGHAQFGRELQVLESNSCHLIRNSAENWYGSRFRSRCACDGCDQRGPVTHPVVVAHCVASDGAWSSFALCHMPGRLRHLWYVRLCLNLFWTNCSGSRRDQAVMLSCLCGLFCCVPWPN